MTPNFEALLHWVSSLEDAFVEVTRERDAARAEVERLHLQNAVLAAAVREVAFDDDPVDGCSHAASAKAALEEAR